MNLGTLRPNYAVRRYLQERFWKKHPETPWVTKSAVYILDSWLRPTDVGLEWGTGRSTVWFAGRVAKLTSIEHQQKWYEKVQGMLAAKGLAGKVDYRLVPCTGAEFDEPDADAYASSAETLGDGTVDFALVDGTIRATCMPIAMRKVKAGGLLILDNANRYVANRCLGENTTLVSPMDKAPTEKWARIAESLAGWRAMMTTDHLWDTRFWVKPG